MAARPSRGASGRLALSALAGVTLAALMVLAPVADGQVFVTPPSGGFTEVYYVAGRVVAGNELPVNHAQVTVEVTGIRGVRVEPLTVTTDCHGDFAAAFPLGEMDGRPRVTARVVEDPERNVTAMRETQDVDTFHRRNNFVFEQPVAWDRGCGGAPSYWNTRVTAWGRVVEGVPGYEHDGGTFHARAVVNEDVHLAFRTSGQEHAPPAGGPPVWTDERGDFKYSFTFENPIREGTLRVLVAGEWRNATLDPVTRIAFFNINIGDDPPAVQGLFTPGLAGLAALGAIATAAVLARGRR